MARKQKIPEPDPVVDPTGWMVSSDIAQFLLLHSIEVKYMCMLGYTYMHGVKVFSTVDSAAATSFRFISMIMACTGGGILVPIILNGIPVPLANDAYPIAMLISFGIHHFFPVIREVFKISPIFKSCCVVFYETLRASVVVTLTLAAGSKIPASTFSFPVFGPIACGAIAGCGGAFLPLNKGLEPIKGGLASPMMTALVASTCLHLFLNTGLSEGVIDAKEKAHVHIAAYFIIVGLVTNLNLTVKSKSD
uniref:Uncharacterized protein n=1 Tax=Helicotheca tamesis TaxID=374047 RepID=A0A7S2MRV2_9STRA|mmetsp:Transcript_2207/g.3099  ORF Transcript_2207/g.3099 Transcript_2207/m.3099 type:complete len:249 (+) Transcript_2207:50-796(+)|eukprot:CAMPEP_0185727722 /NCGR_PEP_ID=MMETSP1171-20130828/3339_1 /TAXON_ID=374046 /ORGANISM="Helicotheca tamensis, Strain CCMP826" /LENGTH=248 /DNA_ID=CAMNT_0028396351 /DNA_START=81 /DNA_END=827 /DNA_ORIENTATION=+